MEWKTPKIWLLVSSIGIWPVFGQLSGDFPLDLSSTKIPILQGSEWNVELGGSEISLGFVQSVETARITGDGTIGNASLTYSAQDSITVHFAGSVKFLAKAVLSGSVLRLVGAKVTTGAVTGSGDYFHDGSTYLAVVDSVKASFSFQTLELDLNDETIQGQLSNGKLVVKGKALVGDREIPGSFTYAYPSQTLSPYAMPDGTVVAPQMSLSLVTSSKNKISGTATVALGDYNDVTFKVTGTRNSKTGISALTLTGTSSPGVSGKINLDQEGVLSGNKNTLKVFGSTLVF